MNTKSFFSDNWKLLAGVVAAVAVVVGGYAFWKERSSAGERAAINMLYEAQVSARTLIAQKNADGATKALHAVVDKYPSSRAAFEASLQEGDIWMDEGKFDDAVKSYGWAENNAKDGFSRVLARYNLGIAQESAGKFSEAVISYDDAMKVQDSTFLKPEILMAKARCFEALKDVAQAIGIYQQIQKDFANRSFYNGAAAAFEKQLSAK